MTDNVHGGAESDSAPPCFSSTEPEGKTIPMNRWLTMFSLGFATGVLATLFYVRTRDFDFDRDSDAILDRLDVIAEELEARLGALEPLAEMLES